MDGVKRPGREGFSGSSVRKRATKPRPFWPLNPVPVDPFWPLALI